ncbi:MAG: hypothetical protein ACRDLT_15620 [Solirubrobacteraceae bacterium]
MPQTLVHGAEEGATKVAEVVESAGARMAKGAGQVAKGAGAAGGRASELSGQLKGQAGGKASELSGQIKGRVAQAPIDIKDAKHGMKDAQLSMRKARLGMREMMMRSVSRGMIKRRSRLLPSGDAMLKAQLVKTSRELAHESSDLGAAVESLNKVIKTNRRAATKGRTRLIGGAALGAALMYHLDAEHGRQRRAATARAVTSMWRGQRQTPAA